MPVIVLLSLLVSPLLAIRWARWLAILQQKEYRLDRLWAFLHSDEGKYELRRILPRVSDFTRTGLKRPKLTARVLSVAALSGLALTIQISSTIYASVFATTLSPDLGRWLVGVGLAYLLLPLTVVIGSIPSVFISTLITLKTLRQAQQLLNKGQPKIIGVGGSYGKTSTKHLLHHFLSQKYSVFVTPRSFNTKLSVAQSIVAGYDNQEIALLEYGAYIRGEIEYLTGWFQPQMAVETGFTPQHLSLFGNRENSILAESELITALPENGVVFCNGADNGAVEICEVGTQKSHAQIKMYSGPNSLLNFDDVKVDRLGQLVISWQGKKMKTKLIGRQYVVNLQAAFLVSQELGLTSAEIQSAAESFVPNDSFILGSMLRTGAYLIDDGGTSNPMGFAAALELIGELPYARKILVTAGMIDLGEESRQIHFQLAKRAKELGLTVVHVGIDGLDEFAEVFEQELVKDLSAAQVLLAHTNEDTVVLLEGKVPKILETQLSTLKGKAV